MTDPLLSHVARDTTRHYYGKYRGVISDNQDPDLRGRVRVLVPSILGETETDWAEPVIAFGGVADAGLYLIPPVQAIVWVEFEEGDLSRPLWTGTRWLPASDTSGSDAIGPPEKLVLQSVGGHRFELDDTGGSPRVVLRHSGGAAATLDENGSVKLEDSSGAALTLDAQQGQLLIEDANGNSITLDSSGVKVEDASGNQIALAASGLTLKGTMVTISGQQVSIG
jgi:hypothetical protein